MSMNDALIDLVKEAQTGDFETLLVDIARDYDIHPEMLRRQFEARHPHGVPTLVDAAAMETARIEGVIQSRCNYYGVPRSGVTYHFVDNMKVALICRDRRATVWAHAVRMSDGSLFKVRMSALKAAA